MDPKQVAVNPKLTLSSQPPHLSQREYSWVWHTGPVSRHDHTIWRKPPWKIEKMKIGKLRTQEWRRTEWDSRCKYYTPTKEINSIVCAIRRDMWLTSRRHPQEDAPSWILSVHLHFCMFWNTDDKNTVRLVETITWISAQETNCWEVVEVHVTECHTFGLWRSIFTFATGTDNQKNQMWRTKWMSVGNALVTCGLSNNVTHHLCFWSDASLSCRYIWLLWLYTLSTRSRFQLWLPHLFCFFALHLFCLFALPRPLLQLSLLGGIFLHPHCQHPLCYPACSSNISTWQEKSGERHTRHVF